MKHNRASKMPDKFKRPDQEIGDGARHPNGGGTREIPAVGLGPMPKRVGKPAIQMGALSIPSSKMPKTHSGTPQRDPFRR